MGLTVLLTEPETVSANKVKLNRIESLKIV